MMKHGHLSHLRLSLVLIVAIFFSPLIEKGLGQELPAYAPGSLIIKFTESAVDLKDYRVRIEDDRIVTGLRNIDILGTRFGATSFSPFYFELFDPVEDRKMGKERMFVFQFPAAADMENIANAYGNNPNIEEAYPNYLYYTNLTPNDTYYGTQWALPKISSPSAWDIETGNTSIVIGILDTGVDLDHPDIDPKLVSSQYRRDEVDINVSYYQSVGFTLDPNEDYVTPDNIPQDRNGHGTHVAGIAGTRTNNGVGTAGVAWECKIMPLRAGFNIYWQGSPYGILESDDWARALDWARNSGMPEIVNMSFGSYTAVNQSNIASAYNSGITLVASSGNDNTSSRLYPAAFDSYVIAVGATNQSDERCDPSDWGSGNGSNYGSWLDIVAPGNSIRSTYYNNTYTYLSGTSMAAPHVAGVAALMLSVSSNLTAAHVRNIIENTADKVSGMGGQNFHNEYGYGRLNAHEAVDAVPKPPTNLYISGYQGGLLRVNWTASTSPDIDYYELWWCEMDGPQFWWQLLTTTSATSWLNTSVTIDNYSPEDTYRYKALAVNQDGWKSDFSNEDEVNVDECPPWLCKKLAGQLEAIPQVYALGENYPNPFNPTTTIEYDLPQDSRVRLTIYDLMGKEVYAHSAVQEAGYWQLQWQGQDHSSKAVPSGVYIYRLVAISTESGNHFTATRKMVLLK